MPKSSRNLLAIRLFDGGKGFLHILQAIRHQDAAPTDKAQFTGWRQAIGIIRASPRTIAKPSRL